MARFGGIPVNATAGPRFGGVPMDGAATGGQQPKPGTREYADWARDQALAGHALPQVSAPPPEWAPPPWWATNPYNVGGVIDNLTQAGKDVPGPDERRGALAPIIRNEKTGAMRFAFPQIAMDVASAFTLPGDVANGRSPLDPRAGMEGQDPATLNRAGTLAGLVGSELPLMSSSAAPATTRALVNSNGQRMPKLVADDLARSGVRPQDVNSNIAALGDGGMLADISPILQGRAAKLATLPEKSQQAVVDALLQRQQQAPARVNLAMGDIAGPDPIASHVAADIKARKDALGPLYQDALRGAKAVDTSAVAANLDSQIVNLRGKAQTDLKTVRNMLNVVGTDQLDPFPGTLLQTRHAIDGMLNAEADGNVRTALGSARKEIDAELAAKVPGIKQVDALYQEQARQKEGFDFGRDALKGGDNPTHPADMADELAAGGLPKGEFVGPSGAASQISQGMLSKMYEIIGTKTNDRLALRQIIAGDGKWNYQKIASAFGQDKADRLLALFQNEAQMAATENLALAGSKTARMAAGGQGMEANPKAQGFLKSALNLDFGDAALAGVGKLTGGATAAIREARNAEIAKALMSGADWRFAPKRASNIPSIAGNPATIAAIIQALTDQRPNR